MADIVISSSASTSLSTPGGAAADSGAAATGSGAIGNATTIEVYFDNAMPESQFFIILDRIKAKARKYFQSLSTD